MEQMRIKAERLLEQPVLGREHFEAQFQFAQLMRSYTGDSLEDALYKYTSLFEHALADNEDFDSSNLRDDNAVEMAYKGYLTSVDEIRAGIEGEERVFGCFSYDTYADPHVARIHFANREWSTAGPLSNAQVEARRAELQVMFTHIHAHDATHRVREVEGSSWLYNLEGYRRLFPDSFVKNLEPDRDMKAFTRNRVWGQFRDSNYRFKKEEFDRFMQKVVEVGPERVFEALPMHPMKTHAPIADFYRLYGIV